MEPFSRDAEPGVESQLIDLSSVPLAVLRLDDTALRRSLVHVVERIGLVHVSSDGGGGTERID
jgi:hypothetical protein